MSLAAAAWLVGATLKNLAARRGVKGGARFGFPGGTGACLKAPGSFGYSFVVMTATARIEGRAEAFVAANPNRARRLLDGDEPCQQAPARSGSQPQLGAARHPREAPRLKGWSSKAVSRGERGRQKVREPAQEPTAERHLTGPCGRRLRVQAP